MGLLFDAVLEANADLGHNADTHLGFPAAALSDSGPNPDYRIGGGRDFTH
jgi:hypothetical protein